MSYYVHGRALVEAQGATLQEFLAFWRPKDIKTAKNNIQKILLIAWQSM